MSKHTPGPWYVSKRNPRLVIESGPRGNAIAKTGVKLGVCSQEQAEANARLIAAAPDLVFQLQAAANYIDLLGGDSKSYRAAIAKATGAAS